MRQLRTASLHLNTAVTAAAELQVLPQLEQLNLHLWSNVTIQAGNGQAANPAPVAVAALLDQLSSSQALKSLHLDKAVRKLLNTPEQQPLFQAALAKLAAAGIQVPPPAPRWRRSEHDLWQAAAGIPAEPDRDLCSLLLC